MNTRYLSQSILTALLIVVACSAEIQVNAQESATRHYVLPDFVKGSVLMINGKTEDAVMNYNMVTEEMIFEKGDTKLAMTNLGAVDTVYLGTRKFIPHGKFFYEVLLSDKISLFKKHKCNLLQAGTPAGYGGTSETSATTSISVLVNSGNMYKLQLPKEYRVKDASQFWILKDNSEFIITSERQLLKIFPQISKELEQFIKQNKLNVRKQEDLIIIITKCNELLC
jgi:hypothetical protein